MFAARGLLPNRYQVIPCAPSARGRSAPSSRPADRAAGRGRCGPCSRSSSRPRSCALRIASSVASAAASNSGRSCSSGSQRADLAARARACAARGCRSRRRGRCRRCRCGRCRRPRRGRSVARRASRWHWIGSSGASVARTTMIEPSARRALRSRGIGTTIEPDLAADRHAVDAQLRRGCHSWPAPARRRCKRPAGVSADARRGADAALELVADHAGAAADIALGHRAARGARRAPRTRAPASTWKALDVATASRRRSRPTTGRCEACRHAALDRRSGTSASRTMPTAWVLVMAIGAAEQALLVEPVDAGHLAVAVEDVVAGEAGSRSQICRRRGQIAVTPVRASRGCVGDHRRVAHPHAGDVGDGVEAPGGSVPILMPRSRSRLRPMISLADAVWLSRFGKAARGRSDEPVATKVPATVR